jgi:hypothetical protein
MSLNTSWIDKEFNKKLNSRVDYIFFLKNKSEKNKVYKKYIKIANDANDIDVDYVYYNEKK